MNRSSKPVKRAKAIALPPVSQAYDFIVLIPWANAQGFMLPPAPTGLNT